MDASRVVPGLFALRSAATLALTRMAARNRGRNRRGTVSGTGRANTLRSIHRLIDLGGLTLRDHGRRPIRRLARALSLFGLIARDRESHP